MANRSSGPNSRELRGARLALGCSVLLLLSGLAGCAADDEAMVSPAPPKGGAGGSAGGAGGSAGGAGGEVGSYVPPTGGYQVTGVELLSPERAITRAVRTASLYARARDDVDGGFFTFLDESGAPTLLKSKVEKSFVVESRDAYGFVRAFMLTGDESFLDHAHHALSFLYDHGWDQVNDGFFFVGTADGTPIAPSPGESPKWSFVQHYGMLGMTAMCEATRAPLDCGWVAKARRSLDEHLWDATPGRGGYFANASLDWSVKWGKGFTPAADGVTTHASLEYLISGSNKDRSRFLDLADELALHIAATRQDPRVKFGIAESLKDDWSIEPTATFGFVGHVIKTAWCLGRAYLVEPKPIYRQAARALLMDMWDHDGFDRVVGAPNYSFEFTSGVQDRRKEYWQVEQGFTAGIVNYYLADNDADRAVFLEMADRSLEFYRTHLVDPLWGGSYFLSNPDGSHIKQQDKGDIWEGAYHDVELAYYAYLYGNLLLHRRPATLHYRFEAQSQPRKLRLTPIELVDERLRIVAVRRNGVPVTSFDGKTRELTLAAGQAGHYEVTFAHR